MTEEQFLIIRNTYDDLEDKKERFNELEKLLSKPHGLIKISNNLFSENDVVYITNDEQVFLTDLLEYRRKEVIALEKEFANL